MVDEVRVLRLLRSISDDISVLKGESEADERIPSDCGASSTRSLPRSRHVWTSPSTFARQKAGDRPLTTAMPSGCWVTTGSALLNSPVLFARRSGFRNVLVHEYVRVNDDIVIDRLKALGDLEDFVSRVAAHVTGA